MPTAYWMTLIADVSTLFTKFAMFLAQLEAKLGTWNHETCAHKTLFWPLFCDPKDLVECTTGYIFKPLGVQCYDFLWDVANNFKGTPSPVNKKCSGRKTWRAALFSGLRWHWHSICKDDYEPFEHAKIDVCISMIHLPATSSLVACIICRKLGSGMSSWSYGASKILMLHFVSHEHEHSTR